MATIKFKAKVQNVYNVEDDNVAYQFVKVPVLDRKHCDMQAFRMHKRYGGLANSDLFKGCLARIKRDFFGNVGELRLDKVPKGVTVDASGFLATITIEV